MELYSSLAKELLESLDRKKKGPPHEDVSASMRGEMAVMRMLADEGKPVTAGNISKTLRMTTSRIAAVLSSLEKKELIQRICDEADKRRVLVTLTDKGMDFCKKRKQHVIDDMSYMLSQLGEEDARHFVRLMTRVHDIMPPPQHHDKNQTTDKGECGE